MSDVTLESQIGHLAACRPDAVRVFERHGIDYCCGGQQSLDIACRNAGINAQAVLDEIERVEPTATEDGDSWIHASLAKLCDHIEQTHHAYLREQLPYLRKLIDKVVAAHEKNHPELRDVRAAFDQLRAELEPHMMKEEKVLFPAVRALENTSQDVTFPFGSVQNPIRMMEREHENAGQGLRSLRELTGGFAAPDDACSAYRALLDGLATLEADLHKHIHKENNILFPRASELEAAAQLAVRGDPPLPNF